MAPRCFYPPPRPLYHHGLVQPALMAHVRLNAGRPNQLLPYMDRIPKIEQPSGSGGSYKAQRKAAATRIRLRPQEEVQARRASVVYIE